MANSALFMAMKKPKGYIAPFKVIEAVIEDMTLKKAIWKKLEAVCKPETIFTTNT